MTNQVKALLRSLSAGDLRQILAIKETQREIERLIQKRDELLRSAEGIQQHIDELIWSRCRGGSGRKMSYGKRQGPTIREMCETVMREAGVPLSAAEVKGRLLEHWPGRDSPTLYNQVFIAMGRSPSLRKVRRGKFAFREGIPRPAEREPPSNGASTAAAGD